MKVSFNEFHRRAKDVQREAAGLDTDRAVLVILKALLAARADGEREAIDAVELKLLGSPEVQ